MTCEVKIGLKNDAKSLTKKTVVHDEIVAAWDNSVIDGLLAEALQEFDDTPKKTLVSIRLIGDDE